MAKLNPIINQAPKNLDVPEFNKKEIVKIIHETVGAGGGGSGSTDVPVYNASLEEKEGKITVSMEEADRNDVFEHRYPVIGMKLTETEDERVETYVLYFRIRQHFIEEGVVIYDLWDSDTDEYTIAHLNLIFMWDGDDAKVTLDNVDIQLVKILPVDGSDVMSQDQETLQEIYQKQPDILLVDAGSDGEQSYKKQEFANGNLTYSCLIDSFIIVVSITEDVSATPNVYSITIDRYDLTTLKVSNQ